MIYGYVRVSSEKQTVENQKFEIRKFAKKNSFSIDIWIEEIISGTKDYSKRQLGVLLEKIQKDDLIVCAELSRLGRSIFMIMDILSICMNKECRVWTVKDGFRLGGDIQSKVLAFAFALTAEIERNLISQRTKEALARKKSEGVVLGRRKGSFIPNKRCENSSCWIFESMAEGVSKKQIAQTLNISRGTLYRWLSTQLLNQ